MERRARTAADAINLYKMDKEEFVTMEATNRGYR